MERKVDRKNRQIEQSIYQMEEWKIVPLMFWRDFLVLHCDIVRNACICALGHNYLGMTFY
jgi:hypothetical protein